MRSLFRERRLTGHSGRATESRRQVRSQTGVWERGVDCSPHTGGDEKSRCRWLSDLLPGAAPGDTTGKYHHGACTLKRSQELASLQDASRFWGCSGGVGLLASTTGYSSGKPPACFEPTGLQLVLARPTACSQLMTGSRLHPGGDEKSRCRWLSDLLTCAAPGDTTGKYHHGACTLKRSQELASLSPEGAGYVFPHSRNVSSTTISPTRPRSLCARVKARTLREISSSLAGSAKARAMVRSKSSPKSEK